MSKFVQINISESVAELKNLMQKQKQPEVRERIHALYLLKSNQCHQVVEVAETLGRDRTTIQRWLHKYRQSGLSGLMSQRNNAGRKPSIPDTTLQKLAEELQQPQSFTNYGQLQQWLQEQFGVTVSYAVAHKAVKYRLKTKIKAKAKRI